MPGCTLVRMSARLQMKEPPCNGFDTDTVLSTISATKNEGVGRDLLLSTLQQPTVRLECQT